MTTSYNFVFKVKKVWFSLFFKLERSMYVCTDAPLFLTVIISSFK